MPRTRERAGRGGDRGHGARCSRSTGADGRSTFAAYERDQSAGRAPARGQPRRRRHARARRSRSSCGARSATARCGPARGAVDARPRAPARRLAAGRGRRLRPARRRGLPAAAPGRAAARVRDRRGRRRRRRQPSRSAPPVRFDFRPSVPDVSTFPRAAWLRSLREALATMTDADLGYGDPRGVDVLRAALADYLGRVRGVVAEPARVVVTCGYSQGLGLVCRALAARRRAADRVRGPELPRADGDRRAAPGSSRSPSRSTSRACVVDAARARRRRRRRRSRPPTSTRPASCCRGERRTALLAWLRERDAIAIEDDYDAEYRYDRAAVGALQGLDPDRVVYAGSASKTLAPALRLGWLVLPPALRRAVTRREAARRPRDGPHRAARVRRLPRPRRARPPPAPHARPLPRAPRRARRRARRGAARGDRARHRRRAARDRRAAGRPTTRRRSVAGGARGAGSRSATMAENRVDAGRPPPTLLLGYAQIPRRRSGPGCARWPR